MTSFSTGTSGIVEQVRQLARVDANMWPTANIANSVNNYLDKVVGYALGADKNFQWDDTNHTNLPIGTTDLTSGTSDYSFLTDESGNRILTLLRIELKDSAGYWRKLNLVDLTTVNVAMDEYKKTAGVPEEYDKLADNIIRLFPTPNITVSAGLKFYFQRSPSYFTASDTSKEPGVAPGLHRGFVIAAVYDAALALGLPALNGFAIEMQKEETNMINYFASRSHDRTRRIVPLVHNTR